MLLIVRVVAVVVVCGGLLERQGSCCRGLREKEPWLFIMVVVIGG